MISQVYNETMIYLMRGIRVYSVNGVGGDNEARVARTVGFPKGVYSVNGVVPVQRQKRKP